MQSAIKLYCQILHHILSKSEILLKGVGWRSSSYAADLLLLLKKPIFFFKQLSVNIFNIKKIA